MSAWARYDIAIEAAIPATQLQQLEDPKWQKFCQIRWPQAIGQIEAKRTRYREILNRYSAAKSQRE